MGRILHDLHPQAGDDEEESGQHVSHVTGPEESAGRPHMSPIPTHAQIRGNYHPPADAPHDSTNQTQKRPELEPQAVPEDADGTNR